MTKNLFGLMSEKKRTIRTLFLFFCLTALLLSCQNPVNSGDQEEGLSNEVGNETVNEDSPSEIWQSGLWIAKPFPQRIIKTTNDMEKPYRRSNSYLTTEIKLYYNKWKANYLRYGIITPSPFPKYAYIRQPGFADYEKVKFRTTSEAMGYGMIIMVVMAGYEPDAKKYFDAMYRFVRNYPSKVNPNLMSWIAGGPVFGDNMWYYPIMLATEI